MLCISLQEYLMGESFNIVQLLEPPFLFVDERIIFIPKNRRLEVNNKDIKIILCLEGTADLLIDGRPMGRIKRGNILVVSRRCRQSYIPVNNKTEERLHVMRIWFDFSSLRLDFRGKDEVSGSTDASTDPEINFAAFLRHHFKVIRILESGKESHIQEWVRFIRHESETRSTGYRFRITGYCRLLTIEIARMLDTPSGSGTADERMRGSRGSPATSWHVEHVKQFLFENYAKPISLHEIAWEVKLSAEHLCRRFKEDTGQTVFSYLRELRIEAAKAYLVSSKQSITEVAARCGFSSSTLFCRIFRKSTGNTPVEYRTAAVKRISFQQTTLNPDDRIY
jgi:AraC-like DNA-binding protein